MRLIESIALTGALFVMCSKGSLAGAIDFETDSHDLTAESGYIRLSWQAGAGVPYELQQDTVPDFTNARWVYRGPDRASFVSGLPDGTYYFRVRSGDGVWSPPLRLAVKHQSLVLAFSLFGIGATVFLLTAGMVVRGARETERMQPDG